MTVVDKSDVNTLVITTETAPVIVDENVLTLAVTTQPVQAVIKTEDSVQHVVTNTEDTITVTNKETSVVVTALGAQGPQGPAGASTTFIYVIAGQNLGGNRAVSTSSTGTLVYPDLTQLDQTVLGITTGATTAGTLTEVQIAGIQTEPSWSWLPGLPIFVGALGTLTQQVPVSDTVLQIARPVTQTKIFVDVQQPIYLE